MAEVKKASLIVLGGPLAGTRCVLPDSGTVTIGSAPDSLLRLDLPGVRPAHARVVVEPGRTAVYEVGTERRLHINDNPVEPDGTNLRNGDIIWLGTPGEEDVVMLQCVLPKRSVEVATPAHPSSEATLAAEPVVAAPATGFALVGEKAGDEELVFAEAPPVSAAAPVAEETPVVFGEAHIVDDTPPETAPHVVVDDFLAEPQAATPEAPVDAQPVVEADGAFVVAEEPTVFDEVTDGAVPAAEVPTVILAPGEVAPAPPPMVAAAPSAPPPQVPAPERSRPDHSAVRRDSARAAAPGASQVARAQTPRPPHAAPHGSHPAARPAARKPKGGSRTPLLALAGLVIVAALAGLAWVGWPYLQPFLKKAPTSQPTPVALAQAPPAPVTSPEPLAPSPEVSATPEAAPSPTPAAAPTPTAGATPTPRTSPSPSPRATPTPSPAATRPTPVPASAPAGPSPEAQRAQQVQSLLAEAEAALAAKQYDAAVGHADGVLRVEPGQARATALRAEATHKRDLARRRFVAGQTVVQTQKQGGSLTGFDTGDADLRKASDFQGRIEFEMSPATGIEAGAAWTLRVFVVNEGKKPMRVQGLTIATNVNGAGASAPAAPKARDIAPQQRVQVGETNGTWRDGTNSWTTEANVAANKGDSLRNTLTWR